MIELIRLELISKAITKKWCFSKLNYNSYNKK